MIQLSDLKKTFLFSLIGALVAFAVLAVITVLVGSFNETASKVLFTLFMVIAHSLVSLAFIWGDSRSGTSVRYPRFADVLFLAIVASFITSVLGTWDVFSGSLVSKLYKTYILFCISSLHIDILSKALKKESLIDKIVYLNFAFIGLVVLMMLPIIYIDNSFIVLGEMYYRILGASLIIDGTLSVLTIIFYRIHMHRHPEENQIKDKKSSGGLSVLGLVLVLIILYILFMSVLPLLFLFIPN